MNTATDPLDQWLAPHEREMAQTVPSQQQVQPSQEKDVLAQYEARPETLGEKIPRWGAQAAARSWEMAGELPGSLLDFTKWIAQKGLPTAVTEKMGENVKKAQQVFGGDKFSLPRPGQLREITKEATGGYTEPANKGEEIAGNLLQDIESTFVPMGKATKGAKLLKTLAPKWQPIVRHIAAPIAANLAKESSEKLGLSESTGQYAKIGTWILTDFLHPGHISKYGQYLFNETGRLSQGQMVPFSGIRQRFDVLRTKWKQGVPDPAREGALKWMDKLEDKVDANGKIHMPELVQGRKDANSLIEQHGGFDVGKEQRKAIIGMTQDIKQAIIDPTETYLARANPQLGETWHGANEIWAAKEQSEDITRFIQSKFKRAARSSGVAQLLQGVGGAAAAAAFPVSKGITIGHQIMKSAEARKYYGNVLADAIRHNGAGVTANLSKLDDILYKMDQQENKKNRI